MTYDSSAYEGSSAWQRVTRSSGHHWHALICFVVHASFYLNSSISSSAGKKTFVSLLMREELMFDMNTL